MEWLHLRRICAAIVVTAALAACDTPSPDASATSHVHANGLQLSVHEGPCVSTPGALPRESYDVALTSVGFGLIPCDNRNRRQPFTISVELLDTAPKSTGHRFRYLGSGRIAWYRASHSDEGGSSGFEWDVDAFERVGKRWIQYSEHKLDEDQPSELWDIAQGTRYTPAPN
jgi:hypothetical protein